MFKTFTTLMLYLCLGVSYAQSVNTFIPPRAFEHRETIKSELNKFFPDIPMYNYIPALIEHESCQHLKHAKCWNSESQLKTAREQGLGLGMITRAYNKDGSLRFDALTELRRRYRSELSEVSWNTIKLRPELQVRMIVLMTRETYLKLYDIQDPFERLSMADAAYNGGYGGMQRERRHCSLTKGCDASRWFGHVERYCLKSKKVLYANRSACDINRHHVSDVLKTRLPKYDRVRFMHTP